MKLNFLKISRILFILVKQRNPDTYDKPYVALLRHRHVAQHQFGPHNSTTSHLSLIIIYVTFYTLDDPIISWLSQNWFTRVVNIPRLGLTGLVTNETCQAGKPDSQDHYHNLKLVLPNLSIDTLFKDEFFEKKIEQSVIAMIDNLVRLG